jgi:hypothetical protein
MRGLISVQMSFEVQGSVLVGALDCTAPGMLDSGKLGWFDKACTDWRLDWKLKIQCSLTRPEPSYGYGQPHTAMTLGGLSEETFFAQNSNYVRFVFAPPTTFRVEFLLPDCIDPVGSGLDVGCSAGGPVSVGGLPYHCSVLLKAVSPSFQARLERIPGGIRFLQSCDGKVPVLCEMQDQSRGKPLLDRLRGGWTKTLHAVVKAK